MKKTWTKAKKRPFVFTSAAEQSYAVDKGKRRPAGMRSDDLFTGFTNEAATVTASAPILRKGVQPHDDDVPVASFMDDLADKLQLRSVMPKRKTESVEQLDPLPEGGQYDKEVVNYRYAPTESQSCGNCVHFLAPGSCELVAGLIRTVDVCDLFESVDNGGGGDFVQATYVPDELAEAGMVVQAEAVEGGPGSGPRPGGGGKKAPYVPGSQRDIAQQRAQNRADDRAFARQQRRAPKRMFTVQAEVTPPGFEPVVKALKRQPGVDNPWAVAWSMKSKGMGPASETVVQAELAEAGDLP